MPSQTSKTHRKTDWSAWNLEFLALAWSIASFAAMIILLAVFDGRTIIDWENVTLNAIISVISVAMKASLTFAVAELIGQWKWILFSRGARPLIDFDRIDMASRGPLGSLRVLLRMKNGCWPLYLGALVFLLAIGLDPFSQQLLQLQQATKFSETLIIFGPDETSAFATRATEFKKGDTVLGNVTESAQDPDGPQAITVTTQLDVSMQAAVLNGISLPGKTVDRQAPMQCPTANCTWDQFQTLGVCHRCSDLTPDLKRVDNFGKVYNSIINHKYLDEVTDESITAYVLPNGHFLANVNGCSISSVSCGGAVGPSLLALTSFGTGNPMKTISMQDIDTLIWSMSMIHFDERSYYGTDTPSYQYDWPDIPLRATECALYYCVKTMHPRVTGNVIHRNASEATDAVRHPDSWTLESRESLEEDFAPENIPPENGSATLEYDKRYSSVRRGDLILHFPDNSTKPLYQLTAEAVWSLSQFFQELLSMNMTGGANAITAIAEKLSSDAVGFNGAMIDPDGHRGEPRALGLVWNADKLDLPDTFATLATSISDGMRRVDEYGEDAEYVAGFEGTPKNYYKAQWGWIALHAAVLLGGVVFWGATVWNSARPPRSVPAWKNSSLATISRGSTAAEALERADMVKEMEKRARKQIAKMPLDHDFSSIQMANDERDGSVYLMPRVNGDEDETGHGERVRVG